MGCEVTSEVTFLSLQTCYCTPLEEGDTVNFGIETETLEFKTSTAELDPACRSIAAMLNKHGLGTLYFGVDNNGEVKGQDISESTLRKVSQAIADCIKPQVIPIITVEAFDSKTLIKVEVSGCDIPYSARDKYYIRSADQDRSVTPATLREFFAKTARRDSWETLDCGVLVANVDENTFHKFLDDALSARRLPETDTNLSATLSRLGLCIGGNLNNAGNLLFGSNQPVTLKMAVFATPEKVTFLDIQQETGNIYQLLETAEKYVLKNIHWRVSINRSEREEIPEIPVPVIRELIANSFAHADYRGQATHELCIYPDKITIFNPGRFASPHTPEEYINENLPSVPRNPLVAKALYLGHKIEQFGSGIKRSAQLCEDAEVRFAFTDMETGFMATLYRGQGHHPVGTAEGEINTNQPQSRSVTYAPGDIDISLNSTEMAILALLHQDSTQTRQALAEKISKTTRTVQRALNTLAAKGYIQREGSKNNPNWKVIP